MAKLTLVAWVLGLTLSCVLTGSLAEEEGYSEYDLPSPLEDFSACGQSKRGYICDPGNNLDESQVATLNAIVDAMKTVDRCLCDNCRASPRHEVLVAVVPRIKYVSGTFPSTYEYQLKATKAFAEYLRDKSWYTSESSCRARTIVVYDITTQAFWTATNMYARKVITDDRAKQTARDAKKNWLKSGNYYLGFKEVLDNYHKFLVEGPPGLAWWAILLIVLGSLTGVGFLVCICCCICRAGGGGSGGGGVWSPSSWTGGGGGCGSSCGGGGGGGGCGGGGGD